MPQNPGEISVKPRQIWSDQRQPQLTQQHSGCSQANLMMQWGIELPSCAGCPLVTQVHQSQTACPTIARKLLMQRMEAPDSLRVPQKFTAKFAVRTEQTFAHDKSHSGCCYDLVAGRQGVGE
jgi:hypothetical protein